MIETEKYSNNIQIITINRPEKLNAFTSDGLKSFVGALEMASKDPEIKIIILTGAGDKAFSCGADIKDYEDISVNDAMNFLKLGQQAVKKIETIPVPVMSAVNGYALGGGCEIALGCDFLVGAQNAKFGLPEIKIGLYPGWGGTQRMKRAVGEARAAELIYMGNFIDAKTAEQWGLLNKVVSQDKLMAEALEWAKQIAEKPREVLSRIKKMLNLDKVEMESTLELESTLLSTCYELEETKELIRSFSKR